MNRVEKKGKNTLILRGVEFHWAKLSHPVDPFESGMPAYEIKITTHDPDQAMEWVELGLNVRRHSDYGYAVALKRWHKNAKGVINTPPAVLDGNNIPIEDCMVGNGSKGDIKLFSYMSKHTNRIHYQFTAVKVIELVPFVFNEVDF